MAAGLGRVTGSMLFMLAFTNAMVHSVFLHFSSGLKSRSFLSHSPISFQS